MLKYFFLACLTVLGTSTLVLTPQKTGGQATALIWIQGATCEAKGYVPLMTEIQNEFPGTLWVAISEFPLSTPQPLTIKGEINSALKQLHAQGFPQDGQVFYGGHSLGSIMVQDFLKNNSDHKAAGMILHGGFIQRKYLNLRDDGKHQNQVNIPTLSVAGELDGLSRVSRFAEAYFTQNLNSVHAFADYPIVVIKGASHNQFFSGEAPSFVKQHDLLPEISEQEAHKRIAQASVNFIQQRLGKLQFKEDSFTQQLLAPMTKALELEGYYGFRPPCYGHELVNPNVPTCGHGPEWASVAQRTMCGLEGTSSKVKPDPNFHQVQSILPVHLPTILNDCDGHSACTMNTIVVVEALYDKLLSLDTGLQMISASELKTKLVSRQNCQIHNGKADAKLDDTDGDSLCAQINQKAIDWAFQNLPADTISRFNQHGQKFRVGEDKGPYNAGPLWIWTYMEYAEENDEIVIKAPMMKTPVDYPIKEAAGFHYCKVLSPARVAEWIYLDGLRKHRSLKNLNTLVVE